MQNIIKDIKCYFPEKVHTNQFLQNEFPNLKLKELTRLTGVEQRHICNKNETSVDIAIKAANMLFENNETIKDDIDYIIFCSAGGDYITPASACIIHDKLNLPGECGAFDFNQGCTGYIYGLSIADSLITSNNAKNILLITSEAISKTIHPKDSSNRAIFGDAATASIIAKRQENKDSGGFVFGTMGSKFDKIIIKHGRERYPLPEYAESDRSDNFGNAYNDAYFYMDGSEVFNFSITKAPELVKSLLTKHKLLMDEIDFFVFHQANQIILETLGKKLNIPNEKLIVEIKDTGNTVSSTIPIALFKSVERGKIKRGNKILLAGFGVGFSWGGTILEF